ncbi:hypothetical protein HmCmsJML188_03399 [Escherichia coli]|nr:hypothetical protein HmCmsJML188_03399 [Escherichia coli]
MLIISPHHGFVVFNQIVVNHHGVIQLAGLQIGEHHFPVFIGGAFFDLLVSGPVFVLIQFDFNAGDGQVDGGFMRQPDADFTGFRAGHGAHGKIVVAAADGSGFAVHGHHLVHFQRRATEDR